MYMKVNLPEGLRRLLYNFSNAHRKRSKNIRWYRNSFIFLIPCIQSKNHSTWTIMWLVNNRKECVWLTCSLIWFLHCDEWQHVSFEVKRSVFECPTLPHSLPMGLPSKNHSPADRSPPSSPNPSCQAPLLPSKVHERRAGQHQEHRSTRLLKVRTAGTRIWCPEGRGSSFRLTC